MTHTPRIVIIGAGFGGLWAARTLAGSSAEVVILDKNNYHTFQALLYQVAAAELEPSDISFPIRSILHKMKNVHYIMTEAHSIDFHSKEVVTSTGNISYDYLLIAAGSIPRFFGVSGARQYAFGLKTMDDAIALRNHILCCLEQACREQDRDVKRKLLTFTIIGGGPTGVEYAGALAELIKGPIKKDYPAIDIADIKIVLIEATDHLLGGMPPKLQQYTLNKLTSIGVDVKLNTAVTEITDYDVQLGEATPIACETKVWVAGVQGSSLASDSSLPIANDGRVQVLPTLQVPAHPEVYVVGDMVHIEHQGRALPFVAPVAIQSGIAAARNIQKQIRGNQPVAFHYQDKGSMATIGRRAAAVRIARYQFTGVFAWILWLLVHVYNLIGFRNRILVMINWAWDYLWHERAIRLILPSETCSTMKERYTAREANLNETPCIRRHDE